MILKLLKFPKMFWKSSDLSNCIYYARNIQGQGPWQPLVYSYAYEGVLWGSTLQARANFFSFHYLTFCVDNKKSKQNKKRPPNSFLVSHDQNTKILRGIFYQSRPL